MVAIGLIAVALPAAPAHSATYTVWSCRGPDGSPVSTEAWREDSNSAATADTCVSGGYLRARLQQPGDYFPDTVRGFSFLTPPGAKIESYRIHLFAATEDSQYESAFQAGLDVNPGLIPTIEDGCTGPGCTFGKLDTPLDPTNLLDASGLKADGLFAGVKCVSICVGGDNVNSIARIRLFRSEVAIRDDDVPVVGAATGTLGSGPQPISGARTMGGAVSDEGGGLASVVLLVDGLQFAQAPEACSQPYTAPAPCPLDLVTSFDVDSARLSPGVHSAELRATDAAGNVATGPAVSFSVADRPSDPAPPAPTQPVAVPVEPTAVRVAVADTRVTIEGRSRRVTGSIKLVGGDPIAGAKVIVRSRPFGVRRVAARVERRLTTDSQGRFSMTATGASRLLELDVDDKTYRAEEAAEVQLLQRLRVEASQNRRGLRNGSTMTLHADVDGAGRGARGKAALVQAIVGGRWTTVEELTLNDAGAAIWRYRFRGTTRTAIYRFRVRVPTAGDVWPWPTTDSPVLRIRVRR